MMRKHLFALLLGIGLTVLACDMLPPASPTVSPPAVFPTPLALKPAITSTAPWVSLPVSPPATPTMVIQSPTALTVAAMRQVTPSKIFYFFPGDKPNHLLYAAQPLTATHYYLFSTHPLLLSWFQIELPDGTPKPVEYPHQHFFTDELRQRLGVERIAEGKNWFDLVRISPSGNHLIYFKVSKDSEYYMDNGIEIPTELDLWQAGRAGSRPKQIVKNVPNGFEAVTWSADEKYAVVTISNGKQGGAQDHYWIDIDHNQSKVIGISYPRPLEKNFAQSAMPPNLSPDGTTLAGAFSNDLELTLTRVKTATFQKYPIKLWGGSPAWSTDGTLLFLIEFDKYLSEFNPTTGQLTHLAQIDPNSKALFYQVFNWVIFPDKHIFVIGAPNGLWVGQY